MTIRLELAYDGSCFAGWQIQPDQRTVQGTLLEALRDLEGRDVSVVAAGRTDAGVHATGQVASFITGLSRLEPAKFRDALNARLPRDVRVLCSRAAPEGFDARRWAIERMYRYYLYPATVGLPHLRRHCWRIPRPPDLGELNRIAGAIVGRHDFTTFATAGGPEGSRVRTVLRAAFYPQGRMLVFEIAADGFLRRMVRSILGTILELERAGAGRAELQDALRSMDRERAGTTAPARGLFLVRVRYGEGPPAVCVSGADDE